MTMSRKHFRLVADILAGVEPTGLRCELAREFATVLRQTNSAFCRQTFLNACDASEETYNAVRARSRAAKKAAQTRSERNKTTQGEPAV